MGVSAPSLHRESTDSLMIELRDFLGESFKSMGIVERSSRLWTLGGEL